MYGVFDSGEEIMAKVAYKDVTLHFGARNGADLALRAKSPSSDFVVIARFPSEEQASAATALVVDGMPYRGFVSECGIKNEFLFSEGILWAVALNRNHGDAPCMVFLERAPVDPRLWLQLPFLSESASRWVDAPTTGMPATLGIETGIAQPRASTRTPMPRLKPGQHTDWVEDANGFVIDGREKFLFWLTRQVLAGNKEMFPVVDGKVQAPDNAGANKLKSMIVNAFKERASTTGKWHDANLKSQVSEKYPRIVQGFVDGSSRFAVDRPVERSRRSAADLLSKYDVAGVLKRDAGARPGKVEPVALKIPQPASNVAVEMDLPALGGRPAPRALWEGIEGAVGAWTTLERNLCVVTNKEHNGRRYLDIRRWYTDADGKLKPGRQGITLSAGEIPDLVQALARCKS